MEEVQHPAGHLLEGLTLVVVLAVVALVSRWAVTAAADVPPPAAMAVPTAVATETPVPTPTLVPSSTPTSARTPTVDAEPSATMTSTPSPTLTSAAPPPAPLSASPAAVLTATNPTTQPLPIPPPMPLVEQPSNVISVLLLGSDVAFRDSVGRTDTIVVVSVNPDLPSVTLLSVPRDFYAWIPGHGFAKINTAFSRGERNGYPAGGPGLIKDTIEYNLGIRTDYYARVGFDGFVKIVDTLGGVEVAVECLLSDTFPDPDSPTGQSDIDWLPGCRHLDGKHALWYARSRWSTSDFDRHRRQQQVLRGLYRQALSFDIIPKIAPLWDVLNKSVSTDLGLDELLHLGRIGSQLDLINVKSRFIGRGVVRSWTAPDGAYVLVPHREALSRVVSEALAPPASARAQQRAFRIEIWNATPHNGLGRVAAERLRWEGFEVVSIQPADGPYPRTQIVDFTTTSKGSPLSRLVSLYGYSADDVAYQPTEGCAVDFRVILGPDYDPCIAARVYRYPRGLPTPTALPPPVP